MSGQDGVRGGSDGHIGHNLAIWGVVTGGAVMAGLFAFRPPWFVWAAGGGAASLWLFAILGLSDGPSRAFLAGTLRKSSYTQIYTTLTRRNVMWVWRRLCDEASDRDGWPTLFRAALTWRLYDKALLIAVAYPLLLLLGQWLVTGVEGRVGSALVLPRASLWPDRIGALVPFAILSLTLLPRSMLTKQVRRLGRKRAISLLILGLLFAGLVFVTSVGDAVGAWVKVSALLVAFMVGLSVNSGGAWGVSFVFLFLLGFFTVELKSFAAIPALLLVAVAGFASETLASRRFARWCVTVLLAFVVVYLAAVPEISCLSEKYRSLFLFLAVFPLLNALFDVLSYAVTLSLLRRGLRARWPFVWGLLDLLIACVLFLGLGVALVAAIHELNRLAGVPLLDLGALFAGVRETPGAYVWLYLMLFSTILPTALHFLISLLGLQGVWPRAFRRPVARLIDRAPDAPLYAVPAAFFLGLVWTLPLLLLGAALWGIWAFSGGFVMAVLGRYFDLLHWIAAVPVGAL
ncbi:hypothetical protein SAMN05444722_0633 [Rhodovulum sp. ES.010]|uniref:hypothetical protein n=1 Tax=Rhodovulum sp. ES.010 TaxID=1882821 RepID=UPI00092C131F|nr:hypothetical protein [Rhodovulum sp. ES.010]SIO15445.1 hypothetical protein SAMN05444722_0633 [Rhodovulum sp. ES.010]